MMWWDLAAWCGTIKALQIVAIHFGRPWVTSSGEVESRWGSPPKGVVYGGTGKALVLTDFGPGFWCQPWVPQFWSGNTGSKYGDFRYVASCKWDNGDFANRVIYHWISALIL
jgi:hypothetical protein